MQPVNAEFLAETGRQIASLSAFLGGFAATFLGILLPVAKLSPACGLGCRCSRGGFLVIHSGSHFRDGPCPCLASRGTVRYSQANLPATGPHSHSRYVCDRYLLYSAELRIKRVDSLTATRYRYICGRIDFRGYCVAFRTMVT